MGRLTYLIIGLIVGGGAGIVGMQIWFDATPAKPPAHEDVTLSETYFLCKSEMSNRDDTMVIRADKSGAKSISFPGQTDADLFKVTETTSTQYTAVREDPAFPEAFATLRANRISGDVTYTLRVPKQSAKLLADICNKLVPLNECRPRIDKILDGLRECCERCRLP